MILMSLYYEMAAAAETDADAMPISAPRPADHDCANCGGRGLTPTAIDEAMCRRCLGSGAKTRAVRNAWIAAGVELELERLRVLFSGIRKAMRVALAAEAAAAPKSVEARRAGRAAVAFQLKLDIIDRHAQGRKEYVCRLSTKR